MRLARLGPVGREIPVAINGTTAFDLRELTSDIDGTFLGGEGVAKTRALLAAGRLPALPGAQRLRIGSPVARPQAVICIGMNYEAHARESGSLPPTEPVIFFKHPNTVIGPNDDVVLPPETSTVDWEVELAIVVGERASRLRSPEVADRHIAGYAISNDVSERTHQLERSGGQWSKGKSFPTFNPLGPWLVPPADLPAGGLRIRSWVNDELRQDSSTDDMIFDVHRLVFELSHVMDLEPGDVVNTGTPQGVALSGRFPYLAEGDVVQLEIAGLGRQEQRVTAAPSAHARRED